MSTKPKDEKKPPREGSVGTPDNELMTWLHSFFHKGEPPEKIDAWQATGPLRDIRGVNVFHEDFKGNATLNQEECALLANKILAAARHDCNTIEKKSWYIIDVTDRHRMPEPFTRKLGPLHPKLTHLQKREQGNASRDEDEEELVLGAKPMIFQYLDRLIGMVERKDQQIGIITGDLLIHQSRENAELRNWNQRLMQGNNTMFNAMQDALDRQLDREDRREENQAKRAYQSLIAKGMQEAGKIISIYAPGLIQGLLPAPAQQTQPARVATQNGASDYGPSEERRLVDIFLEEIRKADADEALLGDWEPNDKGAPRPNPDKPGILTPDQVRLLIGLRHGWIHPDRVDELLMDGGHANAITGEQLMRAQSVVPEAAMHAVFALLGLRTDKRQAAAQPATNTAA